MRRCYAVPGLAGSELFSDPALTQKVWVDYEQLALGNVGKLRLAADGVSPGPPDGVQLYAGGPLPDYYGPAIDGLYRALRGQLADNSDGYAVIGWGYDWRLDLRTTGRALADFIENENTPDEPCTIIGHSLGGLVARMAWLFLGIDGKQNLCRRIITLGTPHWGSYGAVRLWSLDSEVTAQLSILSLASLTFGVLANVWTPQRLAALFATWPSVYWTLPSLLAPDASSDVNRAALFGDGWPPHRGVSEILLADAEFEFQPLLASAATFPPTQVLTTIGGQGYPTANKLRTPEYLGLAGAYSFDDGGDGQVELSSALLPASAQVVLTGAHGDLPNITAGFADAARYVLDERSPPAPPPPVQTVQGVNVHSLHGPPAPLPLTVVQGRPIRLPSAGSVDP